MRIIGGPYKCGPNGEVIKRKPTLTPRRKLSIILTLAVAVITAAMQLNDRIRMARFERAAAEETRQTAAALQNAEVIPVTKAIGAAELFKLAPEKAVTDWWYTSDPSRVMIGPGGEITPIHNGSAIVCEQPTIMQTSHRQCWRVEVRIPKS